MILVTGATGTIGKALLALLAAKGAPVRAMSRNPGQVPAGFEVVRGDFEDADSLRKAVDGVRTVFLLSAPGSAIAGHDLALLDAAKDISKVVKLSAIRTGDPGFEATSAWHLPGEQAIQASGLAWTVLRPSVFASNSRAWAPQIQAGEPIPSFYGDGASGVVDPRDIAAVAAEVLLSDEHDKQIYTLTGPELLSAPQQVAQLASVLGKPLRTVDVPPEQARAGMLAQGMDSAAVDLVLTGFDLVRQGCNAIVTPDVERVLGRPPATFKAWAQDHVAAFA